MASTFDPDRFLTAQDSVYPQVCAELKAGEKRSHWMWFIFPQIQGLGQSPTAQKYAIASLAEARAYLDHPVLGLRLRECTQFVLNVTGKSIHDIFGSPDDMKFHSSMTLFAKAGTDNEVFEQALQRYFAANPDSLTLERI
jgi:uncharacterized protein (DUF1810 family)